MARNVVKKSKKIRKVLLLQQFKQGGRVVEALDLSSNGRMSAWVGNPTSGKIAAEVQLLK